MTQIILLGQCPSNCVTGDHTWLVGVEFIKTCLNTSDHQNVSFPDEKF